MVKAINDIQGMAREELGGSSPGAVSQGQVDALLTKMYAAHAELTRTPDEKDQGPMTEEQLKQRFIDRLKTHKEWRGAGKTRHQVTVATSEQTMAAISMTVKYGVRTDREADVAWAASAAYELKRAEKEGGDPSETTQTRLTRALEDPAYFALERRYKEEKDPSNKAELHAQLVEARERHEARMGLLAAQLGIKPEDLKAAGGATEYLADRVGRAFREIKHGTAYGSQIIKQGRASLLTGILFSTHGAGTREDVLKSTYAGRSREEIKEAHVQYGGEGDYHRLDRMLGIAGHSGWGTEVSGDLAQELTRLNRGEPTNDREVMELSALEGVQQAEEGTGFIARHTMSGTPEQKRLAATRAQMAQEIIKASGPEHAGDDPAGVFGPQGDILPPYNTLAFDKRGNFKGGNSERLRLRGVAHQVHMASDRYREEIDRQEAIFTSIITALAILVTVILLCIPGVNMVVAGILTAVIAGAATMLVKEGMRGGRYGWEEAATDIGMTAIEAATAGLGGGLGKGAEAAAQGAKGVGLLGKAGAGIFRASEKIGLGKIGAAVAREAIVGAVGSAARTAIQDETWKDGLGAGLKKVALNSAKGAAASAVSTAVSQVVSAKLTKGLERGMIEGAKDAPLAKLGARLGPAGREMASQVISQTLGAVAATATDILIDVATGHYHGTFKDALAAMGESAVRELLSSTLRTGAELRNKARYRALLQASRESGQPLTDQDIRTLRLAAISAGEDHYGLTEQEMKMKQAGVADPKAARFQHEVEEGRRLLAGLPPEMQARLGSLDAATLASLRGMMEHPSFGTPAERLQILQKMSHAQVDASATQLLADLHEGKAVLGKQAEEAAAARKQVQRALGEGLEGPARKYLKDVPTEGLEKLAAGELQRAAEMIRSGQFDEKTAAELYAAAKAKSPGLQEDAFHKNLRQAVETVALGRQVEQAARVKQRMDVLSAVSEEGRAAFADLPDDSVRQVKKLLDTGARGSPQLRESLYRAALAENPRLERGPFFKSLDSAVEHVAAERNEARRARRTERVERLAEYPPKVRGPLSALPEDGLFQLRMAAARGEEISPQLRQTLHEAAQRETPGVDLKKLNAALDEAVKQTPKAVTGAEGEKLRGAMLSGVPEELRAKLGEVPILVMKGDDFAAFTRSASAEAVTLIVNGRPVVVMKEGVDPHVLREEGLHALQSQEPRWKERVGALDEGKLSKWDQLPLEEQLALYRNKVAVEIDAHQRLVSSLESELEGAGRAQRAAVAEQLVRARAALDNLGRRLDQVDHLTTVQKRAIETGLIDRRQAVPYLDEAPRLFSKAQQPPRPPKVIVEAFAGPEIESPLDLIQKNPGARVIVTESTIHPPPEKIAELQKAGAVFHPANVTDHIPPASVDEIKIRFPLAHDDNAGTIAFAKRLDQLRQQYPKESDTQLRMRILDEGPQVFSRLADSLTGYSPYALERLKPGGTMEVVFYEERIHSEVRLAGELTMHDPVSGKTYKLVLEHVGTARRGDVAPKSGYEVPDVTDDKIVNVARFRKVEMPAVMPDPVAPTGARGPLLPGQVMGEFSGREFFPESAGGPVRPLDFSKVRFTDKGVDVVEAHVKRFQGGGEEELAMVKRLRMIAAGKLEPTEYDRAFYSHELRESVRYKRLGWPTGQPLDANASYELWNNAHSATLEDYRLREKLPNGDLALFHPDVMAQQAKGPTGARGPPQRPPAEWDRAVPLG
ncbi:MAG TPA: hypothetical protein VND93_10250, partial [Myxococcales bacterium]|nr:hypothetical protein [Myxococcales bacterium]